MLDRPVARSAHLDGRVSASVARRPIEPGLRSTTLRPTCTFAVTSSPAWSSAKVVAHSWRAALLVVVLLAVGCGDASLVGAPAAATDVPTASPVAAVTMPPTATIMATQTPATPSPTLPPRFSTPATPTPRPPTPAATVIPPPQTRAGPTPTWTATPNASIPPGVSGCVSNRAGSTTDCVARHLPPGSSVTETVSEVGTRTFVVNWLPPVDGNGNVPFPYNRPGAGKTIFTTSAGGVVVTFEVDFV